MPSHSERVRRHYDPVELVPSEIPDVEPEIGPPQSDETPDPDDASERSDEA
ncbi:MAG: hypothetical protein AB7N65_16495 [Vicinamibacterales bacterium]